MAWVQRLARKDGSTSYKTSYRDPSGKIRSKTFRLRRDADHFARTVEVQKDVGAYRDPNLGKVRLAEFWEHFRHAAAPPSPSTRELYEMQARVHLLPRLGNHRLNAIDRATVRRFLADLQNEGVGAATVHSVYRLLRRIMSVAVDEGRIGSNPATRLDNVPSPEREEMRFLNAREVSTLSGEVPPRYSALILTLAYAGLRIGEATALRARNLDLVRGDLRVVEAYKELKGGLQLGPTKTKQNRTVTLPSFLRDALRDHLASYGDPSDGESLVFTAAGGGPIRQRGFRARVFIPACKRAGISPIPRPHDLRHTAVAFAIEAGWHPRKVQDMLGHASITTTMDNYGHLFDTLHRDDAEKLDAVYRASLGEGQVLPLRRDQAAR